MLKCAKLLLCGAVVGAGLSVAGGAEAANVQLCFSASVSNVTLSSVVTGMENAIVITDKNNNPIVKADNYFGNGAGSYWTSTLPQTTTLNAGCYNFYFMTKPTTPSGTSNWLCDQPAVFPGNGFTTVSGTLGNVTAGFVLVPVAPASGSNNAEAACPQGW